MSPRGSVEPSSAKKTISINEVLDAVDEKLMLDHVNNPPSVGSYCVV
jgi:hypothetical protein